MLSYKGHRVCIFFDNGPDARNGAIEAKKLFEETFPGIKVYMVYESPWFSVSVGNCLTTEEAIILKGRVSATFPKAFLKKRGDLRCRPFGVIFARFRKLLVFFPLLFGVNIYLCGVYKIY